MLEARWLRPCAREGGADRFAAIIRPNFVARNMRRSNAAAPKHDL
jgi:hypothetical protein